MPHHFVSTLSCACLCLIGLLVGCGEDPELDVEPGQYRLQIEGALTDTLMGPAVLHPVRDSRMVLELGNPEGPGLSIELTTPPRQSGEAAGIPTGRYDVVQAPLLNMPTSARPPGIIAFLSLPNSSFVATTGRLSVTRVDEGAVGGTFELEMTERGTGPPEPRSVRVTGTLRATKE